MDEWMPESPIRLCLRTTGNWRSDANSIHLSPFFRNSRYRRTVPNTPYRSKHRPTVQQGTASVPGKRACPAQVSSPRFLVRAQRWEFPACSSVDTSRRALAQSFVWAGGRLRGLGAVAAGRCATGALRQLEFSGKRCKGQHPNTLAGLVVLSSQVHLVERGDIRSVPKVA